MDTEADEADELGLQERRVWSAQVAAAPGLQSEEQEGAVMVEGARDRDLECTVNTTPTKL